MYLFHDHKKCLTFNVGDYTLKYLAKGEARGKNNNNYNKTNQSLDQRWEWWPKKRSKMLPISITVPLEVWAQRNITKEK